METRAKTWIALAEHFLDTETRHQIPLDALLLVNAGLSAEEAFDIWRYEVTPIVWPNIWSTVGEWAGFDDDWLVREIERVRASRRYRPGFISNVVYRIRVHFNHGTWLALAGCMHVLLGAPPPEREQLARDLHALARHFFDCGPKPLEDSDTPRLAALYREQFLPALLPAVVSLGKEENRVICMRRVERALGLNDREGASRI